MSNPGNTPTADQLAAARLTHWHHNAEPILTTNMLRDWLNASGLVLFTPRAAQLPAPAPSFVEAILGTANTTPTLADTESSRELLTRLILDGGAIPLNLLGSPTGLGSETPDFIVSPLAFPYIFTLRGDKAWKQPPTTSGATKVSPLALNTFTLLTERAKDHATGMTSYDLTTQLGKEVTETAVLRALTELWQHLRVIPVPQPDGAPTLWELITTRFTKQIKAGANAGQPTALSALISLYLGQALVATEEEVETFLSPLAARSRIRDVTHALMSARQLETIAVEGRTVLHIAGEPPAFLAIEAKPLDDIDHMVVTSEDDAAETTGESERITKFIPKPRKVGTGFVTRPGRNTEDSPRERRPFNRESSRPAFNKPWEEERAARLSAAQSPSRVPEDADASGSSEQATPRSYDRKPSYDREGKRPSYGSKPSFGSRPSFGNKPRFGSDRGASGDRPSFRNDRGTTGSDRPSYGSNRPSYGSDRPTFRRNEGSGDSRPPRREFTPRPYGDQSSDSGDRPRRPFNKPGNFGPRREGFSGKPGFSRDRGTSENDRPRRDFGDSRPPRREFTPRPGGDSGDSRPPRRTFGDRPDRPSFGGPRKPGSYSPRPSGPRSSDGDRSSGFAPRKPWTPREGGERSDRNERSGRPSGPPFRKFDAPRGDRPARREFTPRPEGDSGRPSGGFAAKKPYGKPSFGKPGGFAKKPFGKSAPGGPGKPGSTFDKFRENKKPWGNRPPGRKPRPGKGDNAE